MNGKRQKLRTSSLIVSNNKFCMQPGAACSFKKDSLRDGVLGVYSAKPKSVWDRIRLLLRMKTGGWKHDRVIMEFHGEEVSVETHRAYEIVTLDGENTKLQTPIRFWMQRRSLNLLVPVGSA
jgi:diacylglycerol kinase family enzyme